MTHSVLHLQSPRHDSIQTTQDYAAMIEKDFKMILGSMVLISCCEGDCHQSDESESKAGCENENFASEMTKAKTDKNLNIYS